MNASTWSKVGTLGIVLAAAMLATGAWADVVINEIHYHPSAAGVTPPDDPEWLQFVELYNTGPTAVDLSGWSFDQGIEFVFPTGASIPAGGFVLVADDPAFLRSMVPSIPAEVQVYQVAAGSDLNNAGDHLVLLNSGAGVVDDVTYDDASPWPVAADGSGPSLELIHPAYDNAYPLVWKASVGTNGTPGRINSRYTEGPAVLWEVPPRNAVVADLTEVQVMFAEVVTGVVASDLRVAGSPATSVTGSGAGPYRFTGFATPTVTPVTVALGPGAIQDLQAHAFAGDTWIYSLAVPKVVINEIHYNPNNTPTWPDDDMEEFIEIMNGDSVAVDISGWTLTEFGSPGVTFPAGTVLQPGAVLVAAKDPGTLQMRLGCVASYSWGSGDSLSNGGEPVTLRDASGVLVDRVYYDDSSPWPTSPDGSARAPSLERTNPDSGAPCTETVQANCAWQASAWRASAGPNGTCGAMNSVYTTAPLVTATNPVRNSVIETLSEVSVTFSEAVSGVTADDLTVDGVAATGVTGSGAGPYVFTVASTVPGTIEVILRGDGGIADLQSVPFAGDSWLYFTGLPKIVINEIHYHPTADVVAGEFPGDLQFLELYNDDTEDVDLSGFRMSAGVTFTFPAGTTLAPGAFLVLAKNPTFLRTKVTIPGGVTVLQWTSGDLANGGETLELSDSYGHVLDAVPYDDGGEWAYSPDGDGPSLELLNPRIVNSYGNAWRASLATNGTPGAANGRYTAVPPPVISRVHHDPPIPGANQPVTITAFVIDESATPTVWLQYRQDQEPTIGYTAVPMLDDGLHGDGAAGDSVYGVTVAGLVEDQRLDFAIQASDGAAANVAPVGHDGVFPGAGGHPSQVFLCKFSSAALPADFPSYHMITTQYVRNRQNTRDHTEYDATFLRCPAGAVPGQCEVFYNVVENYRGASSLNQNPPSFRIDLPGDHHMASEMGFTIKSLNMLGQQPARQGLGYGVFEDAGLIAPKYHFVRFNTNPLASGGTQNFAYTNVERIDEDFLSSQGGAIQPLRFPEHCEIAGTACNNDADCPAGDNCVNSDDGNCYRGRHDDSSLRWEGFDENAYRVDGSERNGYQKITNEEQDEWTDLITLADAMNCSTGDGGLLCLENTYDSWFQSNIGSYVDAEQWARWFAIHMLLDNQEGGIYRDTGDDYFLYFWPGPGYSHATFLPWDLDAIIPSAHETIWRTGYSNANWPVRRFLRNNANAGLFVGAICEYLDTVFTQASMDARIDALPDVLFPTGTPQGNGAQTKQEMKVWVRDQRISVNNEIRRQTTLQGVPTSPYTSSNPVLALSGQLNQCWAREVRVNGIPATYTIANPDGVGANWSYNFTLTPGMNHILVQTLNHSGAEIDRAEGDVFYNPVGTQHDSLRLILPRRMVNDKTMTIDADVIDIAGGVNWKVWEALGTVSIVKLPERTPAAITTTQFDPHITDPNGSIRFYNGRGTVSFTLNGGASAPAGTYELTVNVTVAGSPLSATTTFTVLSAPAFRTLSGTLSGADLTWGPDEQIHLTGSVNVPSGQTLTINPGTLVMIDAGSFQSGTLINVYGTLNAVGTQSNPIFLFPTNGAPALTLTQSGSASNGNCWRGIDLYGTGTSTMRWVFLTGAGNGDVISHPRPPIIATRDRHTINADYCFFIDNDGMVFSAPSPGLFTIRNSVFQRAGIGAEFQSDGNYLLLEDSYFARIGHAPEPNNLDGDHLHIDGSSSNQTIRRVILNDGGDDGIDHVASTFTADSVIIHDIRDKCISMTGGLTHLKNFLCFGSGSGVRGTGDGEHVTINVGAPIGGIGSAGLTESIIWPSSICSANLSYSDVGNSSDASCGSANFSSDPLFKGSHDFDLQPGSPALTAGVGGTRIGWLGWPYAGTCTTAADCNDSNACTYDECINQQCSYTPIANCATCETDAQCDDANPCTDDACDLGACRHTDNTATCDDLSACTSGDQCSAGVCIGTAVTCNDASLCTTDSCNPASGCVYAPIACNDGNPCTDDSCAPATGCVYTADNLNACSDAVACTSDVCSAGTCVSTDACGGGLTCDHGTGQCVSGPRTATFQQGASGYTGAVDTFIDAALGSQATTTPIVCDGSPEEQILLRFDGIFGSGANQIPLGSTIVSATLTLRVGSGVNDQSLNSVNFHRLLSGWLATDVWAAYAVPPWNTSGGIQADNIDAVSTADAAATMSTGGTAYPITVTTSLQAWATSPSSNYGWAILPTGTDGLRLESSESTTVSYRPLLSVTYAAPAGQCTSDPQCTDGLWCNGTETCNLATSTCQAGTAPSCDDAIPCTTDSCNEAEDGCDHVASDAACNDGNACTDDVCTVGVGCSNPSNTASCSDGDACTTGDACSGGACQAGAPVTCNDNVSCTTDSCAPASGCQYVDNCTGGLVCDLTPPGSCVSSAVDPLPIVAGDTWNYFKGSSEPLATWTSITFDDSAWLAGPSGFGYGTDCSAQHATLLSDMQNGYLSVYMRRSFRVDVPASITTLTLTADYDDAFVAYINGTEVARRNVVGTPPANNQVAMEDHECSICNSTCNAAENIDISAFRSALVAGTNVLAIQAHNLTLASTDFTITPSMTATTGGCTNDAQCSDGRFCNGAETCNLATSTCQAGTPPTCVDGNSCTSDGCNDATGCVYTNLTAGTSCSDGLPCNGNETCDGAGACVAGSPPTCGDGNLCTVDTCVDPTGCVHTPVAQGSPCDNGLWCDGSDACNDTGVCVGGAPPDCSDGVTCTVDACNEATDSCEHAPCAMTVAAVGSRYLEVTPPNTSEPMALHVTGPPGCTARYVDATGLAISPVPVFRSSAEWGTVHVRGPLVIPSSIYTVQAEVTAGVPIGSGAATTWVWGDADHVRNVDLFDILCVLDGSHGVFAACTIYGVDLTGPDHTPDGIVDTRDIEAVLEGYQSLPYPDPDCSGAGR